MKVIIFDSSTIINLIMNGIEEVLVDLKKKFSGKFIITNQIKHEVIDRPLQIKKFELGALKVQKLLDEKVLEMPESLGIKSDELKEKTHELTNRINKIFEAKNEFIHLVDFGEASCLALSILLAEKKIENMIAIDERTARMLGENPENLHKLFEKKLHTGVRIFRENLPKLDKLRFIRSSELIYLAWKKNLVGLKNGNVLDALLYATKFKGASISSNEIEEIKRL